MCVRPVCVDRRECGQQARPSTSFVDNTIDLPWRNFSFPEFGTKFQRKVPLEIREIQFKIGERKPPCQKQVDLLAVSIELGLRLVRDRYRHRPIAVVP